MTENINNENMSGIEVELLKNLSIVRETLFRIGIRSKHEKKLWPSCYAYTNENTNKTYVAHFKELLRHPNMDNTDILRRNTIIFLLVKWKLIKIKNAKIKNEIFNNTQNKKLCILKKDQIKDEQWEIIPKVHENTLHYHITK